MDKEPSPLWFRQTLVDSDYPNEQPKEDGTMRFEEKDMMELTKAPYITPKLAVYGVVENVTLQKSKDDFAGTSVDGEPDFAVPEDFNDDGGGAQREDKRSAADRLAEAGGEGGGTDEGGGTGGDEGGEPLKINGDGGGSGGTDEGGGSK